MQRGRTSLNAFPETIDLNEGSFPSNAAMDHSNSWGNMVDPVDNRLSNYMLSPGDGNISCTNAVDNCAQSFNVWDHGESSSNINTLEERVCNNDLNTRIGWPSSSYPCSGADPRLDGRSFEPSNISNSSYCSQVNSRSPNMQNYPLNRASVNIPSSETQRVPTLYASSSNRGNLLGSTSTFSENNDSLRTSFNNWGSSCKRKALEGTSGQFYPGGSSSSNQPTNNIIHHPVSVGYPAPGNLSISSAPPNFASTNHPEQLTLSGVSTNRAVPGSFPSSIVPGTQESSYRNFLNVGNGDSVPFDASRGASVRHSGAPGQLSQPMSNINCSEFRPTMMTPVNSTNSSQPRFIHVNEARRMHFYPWNGALRSPGSTSSSSVVSGERGEEVNARSSLVNGLEYPGIVAPETRNVPQDQIDWSFAPGASASSRNNSSGSRPSSAWLFHQDETQQSRQTFTEAAPWIPFPRMESGSGHRRSHIEFFPSGSTSSHETTTNASRAPHQTDRRSAAYLMDIPSGDINSLRAFAAVESRHRMIRQVLSAMRRGVHLQAEDYVLVDPFIGGFAELHDQHRDLRLDVDNMSYEELLALEERIGNVNTGLSEEKIKGSLNQRRYEGTGTSQNLEPCCVCQEDYVSGDDIGILNCGHEFHASCVKQWLVLKNLCPICKTTALET